MNISRITNISTCKVLTVCHYKLVHQSAVLCGFYPPKVKKHGYKWRISQGMSRSGNEYGPLVDKPDYSFLDGRPTPLTPGQQKRRQNRIDTAADIMAKLGQIDFAKERFQRNEQEKDHERQTILSRKLKQKS